MIVARRKFSPQYRDEAVKMVVETARPIAEVARELGLVEGTLGNWVNLYRKEHAGDEPALSVNERARLRELEAENRELNPRLTKDRVSGPGPLSAAHGV